MTPIYASALNFVCGVLLPGLASTCPRAPRIPGSLSMPVVSGLPYSSQSNRDHDLRFKADFISLPPGIGICSGLLVSPARFLNNITVLLRIIRSIGQSRIWAFRSDCKQASTHRCRFCSAGSASQGSPVSSVRRRIRRMLYLWHC